MIFRCFATYLVNPISTDFEGGNPHIRQVDSRADKNRPIANSQKYTYIKLVSNSIYGITL